MSEGLPPIPIPWLHRWREFRVRYLPPLMFALLIAIIGWLWGRFVQGDTIIGEVETIRANVASLVPGTVQDLKVDRLQAVRRGQEVVVVAPLDPEQLNAEISAAEAELRLMKARMDLDKTRNLDSYSRLRVDLAEQQLGLDLARIRSQQAESEFDRAQKLLEAQLISRGVANAPSGLGLRNDFGFEVARRDRDALRAEMASRTKTIVELEVNLMHLQESGAVQVNPTDAAVEQAIQAQRDRIERQQSPVVLRSPIDGFVSAINHRAGEKVIAGAPILVISAGSTDRIVAWVHQPVSVRPRVGDVVEVRRMGMGQVAFPGRIMEVGRQFEPVSPMLRLPTANPERIEVGLPLLVQADQARELIAGEPVLLRITRPVNAPKAN